MSHATKKSPVKFLGTFTLAMLSVSAIVSLRNLPTTAMLGPQSIAYFIAAGLCFFIPVALVCAELASGWSKEGGVYLWVEEAFGTDWGFMAVWLQWMESVVWLPAILSFLAATTAYLIDPALEQNRGFLVTVMLVFLWGTTLLNFKGLKTSTLVSSLGVILGTIIPGSILIILGFTKLPSAESTGLLYFSVSSLTPGADLGTLVTFTAILLGLCGMEIPAYHVKNAENPKRDFPKAMFLATAIILTIYIFGSLAIAAVVPKSEMSLLSGPMQAFFLFFKEFGLDWVGPFIAALTLIGSLSILNTWIIGPSKGLLSSTQEGYMPKIFMRVNSHETPTSLLYLQALCGTLLISLFVFNPSIHAAYWIINTLAAQLYLVMYFILFLAAIKLRYSQPNVVRHYKIPGGKIGIWLVCGVGAITCLLALLIGFVRPTDIPVTHSASEYALILLAGMVVCSAPPFFFMLVNKKKK
jgi:amino acid transporter